MKEDITYAHDAEADVFALSSILTTAGVGLSALKLFSMHPMDVTKNLIYTSTKHTNLPSLHPLISSGVCTMYTAENIAGSGLALCHLKKIFDRACEDGLRATFCAKVDGKP